MGMDGSGLSVADALALQRDGNDGNWGMGGGYWIFFLFFLLAWGNGGWGGFGNNGAAQGALTRGELCQDMNFQSLENAVRGIQQGLCDGFYAQNSAISNLGMNVANGFHGVDNAICNLGYTVQQGFNASNIAMMQAQNALQAQLADCCCTTQRAIDGVNYNMATNTCAITNQMNNNTRDIIDSQNAGTRAILDYLCQDKISTLQNENQSLRLAASQAAQNNVLTAAMTANTAEIIRRAGNDCPVKAYVVPNPNCCYGYGAGYGFPYGNVGCNNGGCGCN